MIDRRVPYMISDRIRTWMNIKNTQSRTLEITLGLLVLVLGVLVRFKFVSGSNYPYNDGGLFYRMTEELVKNRFLLPKYTLYNRAEIPFAYPPLAFYLIGSIHKLFGVSLLVLFKYFPLIISFLIIPTFYFLTKIFFEEKIYRLLAVYLFVTLPRSFEWFVMGGGVTRSLGFLFAMLSVYFLWEAFQENKFNSDFVWGTVFSALTILSHPLTSLFLAFSLIVIYLYHFPVNIKFVFVMAGVILITTSPWWGTVIKFHGISPFIGASNTGSLDWFELKNLITQNYGYENPYFLAVVSMLAIFGLFSKRKKLSMTLGILCVVGYFVIPRGGTDYLTAYLPLLAVLGFQVVTDGWNKESSSNIGNNFPDVLSSKRSRILLIFIFAYVFLGAYTYKFVYNKLNLRLNESNVQAMAWLKDNSIETDTVISIPPNRENRFWWNDYISEWLPALSERESKTTVQGFEWKPASFDERIFVYSSLRNCDLDFTCIMDWQNENAIYVNYIYLDNLVEYKKLSEDILESGFYSAVFENDNVMILEKIDQ